LTAGRAPGIVESGERRREGPMGNPGPSRKHPWPVRKDPLTGRYEVCVNGVWVSRQRAWQKMRVLSGRCRRCGRDRHLYAAVCDGCAEEIRTEKRHRFAHRAWHPGSPGRKPKTADERGGDDGVIHSAGGEAA